MIRILESDPNVRGLALAALLAGIALVAWAALVGMRARSEPSHCPVGTSGDSGRCCAAGQRVRKGACHGTPTSCPSGMQLASGPTSGCVVLPEKVLVPGGSLLLGPTDWDGPTPSTTRIVSVRSFYLDQAEVTEHRFAECTRAGMCPARDSAREPGLPVSGVDAALAERFCAFAGGRLPTGAEWTFAAAGAEGRRYPWGAHGLVCRRAVYGRVDGPCTVGAQGPDLAGIRQEGETPAGIVDLAGNVAEWAKDDDGHLSLRGGSYASNAAADLKSWSERPARVSPEAGFRCAYPAP